jgi:hypothetical protein
MRPFRCPQANPQATQWPWEMALFNSIWLRPALLHRGIRFGRNAYSNQKNKIITIMIGITIFLKLIAVYCIILQQ